MDDARRAAARESARRNRAVRKALCRLGAAVMRLGGDTAWILDSLAETVSAMKPIQKGGMSDEQKQLLIELDAFTTDELDHATREVNHYS